MSTAHRIPHPQPCLSHEERSRVMKNRRYRISVGILPITRVQRKAENPPQRSGRQTGFHQRVKGKGDRARMVRRPRAGGPARQAAKVASLGQDRPNAPRAFADPPSLHFSVNERREETGRVLGPRSGLGVAEVPPAPEDPSRLRTYRAPGRRPPLLRRTGRPSPSSDGRKRDGSSGREAASAEPRCLRHPKTRPAALPRPCLPAAGRRSCGGQAVPLQRKRGVSPGRMSRPCSRAQPGGRKRECTSERSQDGEANARRIGLGSPRAPERSANRLAHPERPERSANRPGLTPSDPPRGKPAVVWYPTSP